MLGIAIADAVLIGTLIVAAVTAYVGAVSGKRAKEIVPPEPALAAIGTALVDRAALRDNTEALLTLARAIEHHARVMGDRRLQSIEDRIEDALDALSRPK